jgi:hypothetical protein
VRVVADDDKVSSDDDLPLQRRLRLLRSVTSTAGGPPPTGWQVSEDVITLRPDPLMTAPSVTASQRDVYDGDEEVRGRRSNSEEGHRRGGPHERDGGESRRGLSGPRSSAHPGYRCQEGGNAKRLHSLCQAPLQGHLEAPVR